MCVFTSFSKAFFMMSCWVSDTPFSLIHRNMPAEGACHSAKSASQRKKMFNCLEFFFCFLLLLLLFDHTGKKKSGLETLQTYVICIGHEVATFASLKFKSYLNLKKKKTFYATSSHLLSILLVENIDLRPCRATSEKSLT